MSAIAAARNWLAAWRAPAAAPLLDAEALADEFGCLLMGAALGEVSDEYQRWAQSSTTALVRILHNYRAHRAQTPEEKTIGAALDYLCREFLHQ